MKRWQAWWLPASMPRILAAGLVAIAGIASAKTARAATAKADPAVSIMQGFGFAYSMSVTRVGIYDWEIGLLNSGTNMLSYGVMKVFRMDGLYSGIGPTLSAHLLGAASPGVFAALGYEYVIALGIFARAEVNTEVAFNGTTQASSAIMIGWGLW